MINHTIEVVFGDGLIREFNGFWWGSSRFKILMTNSTRPPSCWIFEQNLKLFSPRAFSKFLFSLYYICAGRFVRFYTGCIGKTVKCGDNSGGGYMV